MAAHLTDIRRSRRRDDARWFYACSLGLLGALLIELGHPDLNATALLAIGAADRPTPGSPNTSPPRI